MNRRKLSAGLVVGAMALLGFGVTGGVANAAPPALPAPSIFTLPLPVPLAVTVTTGPGGAITDVSVDPADAAITVTKARPGKVSFTTDTDGVKVSIKSKGQSQSMSARAGSLDAFTANGGAGSWSGEVFPGVPGSVAYVVGGTPDAPTITVDPAGIVGGGVAGAPVTKVDDDGDEVSTKVVVTFTSGTLTRDLTIRLKVENESDDDDDDDSDDDSDSSASLRVTLGKIRGVPGSEAAGPKTWGAILCDGTPGTISYVLGADGTISGVTTTPADARIKTDDGKVEVRFATGERVKIRVSAEGTGFTIKVSEKIRCRDAEDPTVNSLPADVSDDDDDDDDDHDGDHHRGGDDNGGRHGGDDKKSDD